MTETKQEPAWKETVTRKINTVPNQCDYCDSTPNVLYVFASNDASIEEFSLCLACRNFLVMRIRVLIENKKAERAKRKRDKEQIVFEQKRNEVVKID